MSLLRLLLLTLLLAAPSPTFAQPPPAATSTSPVDRAEAERLFKVGREEFQAGKNEQALATFRKALDSYPSNGIRYHIALSEERLGRLVAARRHFLELAGDLPEGDERKSISAEKAVLLERRFATLTIKATAPLPVQTVVTVSGVEGEPTRTDSVKAESLPRSWVLDPGSHMVMWRGPSGGKEFQVTLREGGRTEVEIQFRARGDTPPLPSIVRSSPAAIPSPGGAATASNTSVSVASPSKLRVAAYASLGVTGAGVVVGGIFLGLTYASAAEFQRNPSVERADETDRNSLISELSIAVAVVSAVSAGVLLLVEHLQQLSSRQSHKPSSAAGAPGRRTSTVPIDSRPSESPCGGGAAACFTF